MIRHWLMYGLAGAGAGFGLRGLASVDTLLNPRPIVDNTPSGPVTVSLGSQASERPHGWIETSGYRPAYQRQSPSLLPSVKLPQAPAAEEKPEKQNNRPTKQAAASMSGAANAIYDTVIKPTGLHRAFDFPFGNITVPEAKPWNFAGGVAAGYGAGRGAYALADWMFKKRRNNELDGEMAASEQEYLDAVKELRGVKTASLDKARELTKTAEDPPAVKPDAMSLWGAIKGLISPQDRVNNVTGPIANGWLGLATAASIPAAHIGYSLARDNSNARAMREALMRRQRAIQKSRPAPIVLTRPDGELEEAI
jgi:hypothetical protein